jgi:hypothetical protein
MSAATTIKQAIPMTAPTAPATPSAGCQLPCIHCHEQNANVTLRLAEPNADNAFACEECGGEWGRADIEAIIRRWTPILKWISSMPVASEEAE